VERSHRAALDPYLATRTDLADRLPTRSPGTRRSRPLFTTDSGGRLRRYFALVTPWFFDHATVYCTDDRSAAALWARVGGKFEPDIADYDARLADACGAATIRFVELDQAMPAAHPAGMPHHYLAFLAVAPARQGHGIGSQLLRTHHRLTDRHRLPTYLEATGRRNAALYARHGYTLEQPFPIGTGPPLYPMLRRAQ
jgi:GNAT superfamily N-acetyltransferase